MNWRHRVEKAITGKFTTSYDGSLVVGFNEDVVKVIDKCRIKYSGYRDMKHISGNSFNKIKYYDVGGTTYRITMSYYNNQCGRDMKAFKYVEKMVVFKSYNEIPRSKYKWDYKRSNDNQYVCWEYIRGSK
tara:strand:- start:33 stop:422 length:390 start_codon:yes stop_codon:yes gene_type:complete